MPGSEGRSWSRGQSYTGGRRPALDWLIFHLARRRTFFFPLAITVMLILGRPNPTTYLAGLSLIVLGEVVRIWASGQIRKCIELSSSGPFGCVRNPLYFGSFIMTLGYSIMSNSVSVAIFAVGVFILLHTAAILYEEHQLMQLFGDEFAAYCKSVPRLIPRWPRQTSGTFSWRGVLDNKEHVSALFAAVVALAFALRMWYR